VTEVNNWVLQFLSFGVIIALWTKEAMYWKIQWICFYFLSLLPGIIVLKHSEMFVSVIVFPKVSVLISTYNNNITVLIQLLLRPSIITAQSQMYINVIILIDVMRLIEMLCKIIPSLVHILYTSIHIIYLLMHSGRGLSQWPFG